jgi:hypothetical protein
MIALTPGCTPPPELFPFFQHSLTPRTLSYLAINYCWLALAWITALVFLASGSLWSCLLVHAGLAWVLFQRRQPVPFEGADSEQAAV